MISQGGESGVGECRRRGRGLEVEESSSPSDWKVMQLRREPEAMIQLVWEVEFGASVAIDRGI